MYGVCAYACEQLIPPHTFFLSTLAGLKNIHF